MCEFCTKHGEGKKWYLNVKNYSNDLLSDIRRRKFTKDFFYWTSRTYTKHFGLLKFLSSIRMPIVGPFIRGRIKDVFINDHWGQIVPIEDVEKILSFTNSIVRIPCICRKVNTGKEVRACFALSMDPNAIGVPELLDQSFFGGPDIARFESVDKRWAVEFMKEGEMHGKMHSAWTFRTPFIAGICNCDYSTGCIPMKMYREATPLFFKGEYIAKIDRDKCGGCGICIKICPFTAIENDTSNKKVKINIRRCYGCGICRAVCAKSALSLTERQIVFMTTKV